MPILAILHIIHSDGSSEQINIDKTPFNIGRGHTGNDYAFSDREGGVSRKHIQLTFEQDRILVTDLGSSNGTFVRGTQLEANQPQSLSYGQRFEIGSDKISLYLMAAPPHPQPEKPAEAQPEPVIEPLEVASPTIITTFKNPPPAQPLPPPPLPLTEYGRVYGVQSPSHYMHYLPPIYHPPYSDGKPERTFLDSFLLGLEEILTPLEQTTDNFDLYLDPKINPLYVLDYLASWIDLSLDERWPEERRRQLVAQAALLYKWRGTRFGLSEHIKIYTDLEPEIKEPEDQDHHFEVLLRIPKNHWTSKIEASEFRSMITRIIEVNKPAHTSYTLEIVV